MHNTLKSIKIICTNNNNKKNPKHKSIHTFGSLDMNTGKSIYKNILYEWGNWNYPVHKPVGVYPL